MKTRIRTYEDTFKKGKSISKLDVFQQGGFFLPPVEFKWAENVGQMTW